MQLALEVSCAINKNRNSDPVSTPFVFDWVILGSLMDDFGSVVFPWNVRFKFSPRGHGIWMEVALLFCMAQKSRSINPVFSPTFKCINRVLSSYSKTRSLYPDFQSPLLSIFISHPFCRTCQDHCKVKVGIRPMMRRIPIIYVWRPMKTGVFVIAVFFNDCGVLAVCSFSQKGCVFRCVLRCLVKNGRQMTRFLCFFTFFLREFRVFLSINALTARDQ